MFASPDSYFNETWELQNCNNNNKIVSSREVTEDIGHST